MHPVATQLLASASYDNNICVYKEEDDDWECKATLKGHTSTVWSLTFDAAGVRMASCSDDRTVKIWKEYTDESAQGEFSNKSGILFLPASPGWDEWMLFTK